MNRLSARVRRYTCPTGRIRTEIVPIRGRWFAGGTGGRMTEFDVTFRDDREWVSFGESYVSSEAFKTLFR